jgi:ABC-2 type transport system ATP-binding protein
MKKLGRRHLTFHLQSPLQVVPHELEPWTLALKGDGYELEYDFDASAEKNGIPELLGELARLGITFKDLSSGESSLEDIFVRLLDGSRAQA